MSRLEYRLFDHSQEFPLLYFYDDIESAEIAARFACDYFVKDKVTYEKTSCAASELAYIIYIKRAEDQGWQEDSVLSKQNGLRLELRQYQDNAEYYPIVHTFQYGANIDILLQLQSDFVYWLGQEWQKSSVELDEDRKVYVYYAQLTV